MTSTGRVRTTQPMPALLAAAAATLAALLATRPRLAGSPTSWTGDDLAIACMWWGAVVGSAWLALTTLACAGALARGQARAAHRIARWAPPLARRVLQAALVSTSALVPSAAYAAPPSVPITVHVDVGGRLTTDTPRPPTSEVPIIPNPAPPRITTTTAPSTRTPSHKRSPVPVTTRAVDRFHVVRPGDNLWQIARTEVSRASNVARPNDSHIAPYWRRVIAANRATLRSGDPSLIFPGEVVTLP